MKNIGTLILICLYFFFSGVEYAVILPSLNQYLLKLNAEPYYIGLVLSAFSFGGLISAPIYGRISDKSGSSKPAVMISNLFEIGGNLLYLFAYDPLMVLFSRFLAGVGSGAGSSIFGMISRSTGVKKRTAVFSLLMSLRQFGLLIGPACNLFLVEFDFYLGKVLVEAHNSPGLFMAILWVLHQILMAFFYKELQPNEELRDEQTAINDTNEYEAIPSGSTSINEEMERPPTVVVTSSKSFWVLAYKDLFREEVILCLFINFVLMFVQTGVETLLTPLTLQFFNWGEFQNSIYFCAAGAVVILSFLSVGLLSRKLSDRVLILIGTAGMSFLYLVFLVYIIFATKNLIPNKTLFAIFATHGMLVVFDLPYMWVPQAALFSKITSNKNQAFNQGIRMLAMRLGQILGPLWAGSLLTQLPLMISVDLAILLLLLSMVVASYSRLKIADTSETRAVQPVENGIGNSIDETESRNERSPLLQNGDASSYS